MNIGREAVRKIVNEWLSQPDVKFDFELSVHQQNQYLVIHHISLLMNRPFLIPETVKPADFTVKDDPKPLALERHDPQT